MRAVASGSSLSMVTLATGAKRADSKPATSSWRSTMPQDLTRTFGALAPGNSATLIVARGPERLEIPVVAAPHPTQLLH